MHHLQKVLYEILYGHWWYSEPLYLASTDLHIFPKAHASLKLVSISIYLYLSPVFESDWYELL